jgi:taurine dioxygenase
MGARVEPLTGVIGAEVSGVDLRTPLPPDAVDDLRDALTEHLVLFFRDQHLTDEQHRDFAAQFGALEPFVFAPPTNDDVPEMHALSFDDGSAALGSRVDSWHTDGTFM